ncbi:VOC family protein [Diaphorobacter sp.]|uniref:VOC family protein n=1 Tax=Diaphorobacter sp. TaxID=1934310 RepID=UPI0028B0AF00|nr:VOC family protein [Diaphorobacter sp.]
MTPSHSLDHVVIAVHDLARSIAQYRALGFTVHPGGDHQGRSSHNALIVLADGSYLELKAWRSPAPEERWWSTLDASGEGLVDFALVSQDPKTELADAQARGLHTLRGPVPGERMRPDGQHVRWTTARHDTSDVPFLCGDITPRNLRVPDAPELLQHANGATGVAAITVDVRDLEATLARWQALLGPAFTRPAIAHDDALGAHRVRIPLCGFDVVLQAPRRADSPIAQRLAQRGEGPCEVRLHGVSAPLASPAEEHGFVPDGALHTQ